MAKEIQNVQVVPNLLAPDVFADDAIAIEEVNGTTRITFAVAKLDEGAAPSPMSLVVVGRVVMGDQSAQRLAISLINHFQSRGVTLTAQIGTRGHKAN